MMIHSTVNQPAEASLLPFVYDRSDETLRTIYDCAGGVVKRAIRQMNVSQELAREHYKDLVQTAAVEISRYLDRPRQYAFAAARRQVVVYIINQVFNGRYDNHDASRTIFRTQQDEYDDLTLRAARQREFGSVPRPVEEAVAHDPDAVAVYWETAERALREALAGMREKADPRGVHEQARTLRLSCQGMSRAAIALHIGSTEEGVRHQLLKLRPVLERFLALPPAEQARLRARGRRLLLTPEELTAEVINDGELFVVHGPQGGCFFYLERGRLRALRRQQIDGRLQTRKTTVDAPLGAITAGDIVAAMGRLG